MERGLIRKSMTALLQDLQSDAVMLENKVTTLYRLNHPSAQISGGGVPFTCFIEPSGFSQTAGAGALDAQYFFWVFLKCKPSAFGINEEERLTEIMEYLASHIHAKMWGRLNTYCSRAMINYRSVVIKTNNRDIHFDLAKDEIGATLMFWQSEKSAAVLESSEVCGDEG